MQPLETNNLIFLFLRVSNPRVHLQEDSCTYNYGLISTFYMHRYKQSCGFTAYTDTCKTEYTYFPEDEPSGSKRVEDIIKIRLLV